MWTYIMICLLGINWIVVSGCLLQSRSQTRELRAMRLELEKARRAVEFVDVSQQPRGDA